MSDYVNARFKSHSCRKYVVPKLAREYQLPSHPFTEQGAKLTLSKNKNKLKSLENRSRVIAESSANPKLYDKVANSVQISSLGRQSMVDPTFTKDMPVRVITQPNPNASGTITASSKPIPIVERVGQIYQHPPTRIGETLLQQEAMRNIANLPDLLKKLQGRLSVLPQQLTIGAMGASPKPAPPPSPHPQQSSYFTPKTSARDKPKTDSSQSKTSSSDKSTRKPSAQRKAEESATSSLSESSGSDETSSSSSSNHSSSSSRNRKARATRFIKYLEKIKSDLNEYDDETTVDAMVVTDMKEKGFNVPATRTYKTHKGLHDYIMTQITNLSEVLDE